MDFAQVTLRALEEDMLERRKMFKKTLKENIAELSNSIRGTSVSKFKVERLMKNLGEKLERVLLTELPQKQNVRIAKKLKNIYKDETKELEQKLTKKDEEIAKLKQQLQQQQQLRIKLDETQERLAALQQQEEMTKEVIKTNTDLQKRLKEFQDYFNQIEKEKVEKDRLIDNLQEKVQKIDKDYQNEIAKLQKEFKAKLEEKDQYWKLRVAEATVSEQQESVTSENAEND